MILLVAGALSFVTQSAKEPVVLAYTADPSKQSVQLYWKDDSSQPIGSLQRVKDYVEHTQKHKLLFAMNGGMYDTERNPVGLFIQEYKTIRKLNTASASGNFYLKPNGVFYLTKDNKAFVCETSVFKTNKNIRYATQSGPMLVIDGKIHPEFKEGSNNVNIRNGVGILPDGKIIFALSKEPVNLYDFAEYFQSLGCKNALYMDGFVSRAYAPEQKWTQTDGDFGVIIGVTGPR